MPRAKKTWADKMRAKPPHAVILDKAFAGVPQGAKLLISSPQEIADFLKTVPAGRSLPIQQLRRELAARHHCDAACPVSTAIFLRTLTEYSFEQVQAGVALKDIPPVWRVIEPKSPILKKLSFDAAWITTMREQEGLAV
ncbi:MAG: hypothetical protein ACKO15_02335 [Burkholderiales bacterium]